MFVDAHAHLDPHHFPDGPEPLLERAFEAGVDQLVVVGLGLEDGAHAADLARAHPGRVFAAVAIHPHDARDVTDADLEAMAALARRPEVVAVGETGLDYHYDHSPREVQREVFARFCRLAKEVGKPLVVHTREAEADTVAILEREAPFPAGGQIHSFTGTLGLARPALDLGFHVSFSGVVTFANADDLRAAAREVPLERLLVETDCPYLAPAPFRGRKNEPMFVTAVAGALAAVKGVSVEALAERTTANARRLFGLGAPDATRLLAFASGETLHLAVHRPEVTAEALLAAARRWPLKKVRRLAFLPFGAPRPELVEAVRRWAKEIGRPVE